MAKVIDELIFEVKAKLTIPKETADDCCRLLEMYLNADSCRTLITEYDNEKGYKLRVAETE